jgi:dienelactone hydrolase
MLCSVRRVCCFAALLLEAAFPSFRQGHFLIGLGSIDEFKSRTKRRLNKGVGGHPYSAQAPARRANAMRKTILIGWVFLLGILPPEAFSASSDPSGLAAQFVDLMAKGDFAAAAERYDETMRQALPEAKLKKTWQTLQEQAGQFKERLHSRSLKMGAFDIILVTCQFESARVDVKVALNSKGEVSGLFFLPSTGDSENTGPPAYVSTNAFLEKEFTVVTGEWRLPGTLTMPAETALPCPAVVLVHGSGPNDRDQTIGAVKPFRDLAWGLGSKGIAVLRYEKRTRVYADKFKQAELQNFTVREETIDDALSAAKQLRQADGIDPKRVFVLGLSLGGMVAPRIGLADPQIAGLIIMAGTTRPLEDLIVEQTRYLISLEGEPSSAEQEQLRALQSAASRVNRTFATRP